MARLSVSADWIRAHRMRCVTHRRWRHSPVNVHPINMENNASWCVHANTVVVALFKKTTAPLYAVATNLDSTVTSVNTYHRAHPNRVTWEEHASEMALSSFVNVRRIVSEVNVKRTIRVKRIHASGIILHHWVCSWRERVFFFSSNSTCYRINDFTYKCVCDQVHTGKNCQGRAMEILKERSLSHLVFVLCFL